MLGNDEMLGENEGVLDGSVETLGRKDGCEEGCDDGAAEGFDEGCDDGEEEG